MSRQYKAFISYSWADKEWAGWLHRTLETYRPPKGAGDGKSLHPIFKDREEEAAGGGIGAAIEAALDASDYLIVVCSPNSATSPWVNREVAWFKTRKDTAHILALVVEGEPGASLSSKGGAECFPKTLLYKVGDDLQPTEELEDPPLAADARKEGDGKRGAKLKLAAALLGVGLDTLVRRDDRRRAIRRRIVTSAAFTLAAVLGALSVFAFNQRDAAIMARNDAVKARDDAEELIELVLTDLKSDLEGFGTLKSVTAIGNRAIGYYEGQDVKALSPDQLGRRARVLLMLGEADNKRGDLTAALARYETAAATTGEQLARDPENPQRMFDHAQSVFWVGYIAWQRGDRVAAKRQFTEYHDLAQKLVASDPANEDWQMELKYALNNLGTLAMDDGDTSTAQEHFGQSLQIVLAQLQKDPDDLERTHSAGQAYAWMADSFYFMGDVVKARKARESEIALYEQARSIGLDGSLLTESFFTAEIALAKTAISLNDIDSALLLADQAAREGRKILAADPQNAEVAERLTVALTTLAQANMFAGNIGLARTHILAAGDVAESLPEAKEEAGSWAKKLSIIIQLTFAQLESRTGDTEKAVVRFESAARDMRTLIDAGDAGVTVLHRYAAALAGRARLTPEAPNLWREIVDVLGPEKERSGPEALTVLMEAFLETGKPAEAERIRSRLYEAGYRHPDFLAVIEKFP